MLEHAFEVLLKIAAVYAVCGTGVAVVFFTRWLKDFDPSAVAGSRGFRVLVTPGIIALLPLVVMKVFRKPRGGTPDGAEALRRNHFLAFILLAVFGSLLFAAALVWREPSLAGLPAVEIPTP